MTEADKVKIREIIATLQRIDNGEKVFFNISQYERLGLITIRKKWEINNVGNKVQRGQTYHLTDKARKYLNVIV